MTKSKFKPFKTFKVQCKVDAFEFFSDKIRHLEERMNHPDKNQQENFYKFCDALIIIHLKKMIKTDRQCLIKKNEWYTVITKRKFKEGGYIYQLSEPPRSSGIRRKRLWWHSSWFSQSSGGENRSTVPNDITGKLVEELNQNPELVKHSQEVLEKLVI